MYQILLSNGASPMIACNWNNKQTTPIRFALQYGLYSVVKDLNLPSLCKAALGIDRIVDENEEENYCAKTMLNKSIVEAAETARQRERGRNTVTVKSCESTARGKIDG